MAVAATTSVSGAQTVSNHLRAHALKPASMARLGVAPRVVTPHMTVLVDTQADLGSPNCGTHHAHGTCSLRGAINRADSDAGHYDAVIIPAHFHITLTQNVVLSVTNSMDIVGGVGTSVSGGFTTEVFYVYNNAAATITGLRIQNGQAAYGGGIYCGAAALVLSGDAIVGNVATTKGAGLYSEQGCELWIDSSVFASNNVGSGYGGGAYIYGSASVIRTTFGGASPANGNIGTYGAGIYEYDGNLTVTACNFTHNTSNATYGEGVGLYNDEIADVSSSNFTYNTSAAGGEGAGINNEYVLRLTNSNVNFNSITGSSSADGAGLYSDGYIDQLHGVNFLGNSSRVTGSNIYGGAVYINDDSFDWTGGQVVGTVNCKVGTSCYIEGGALYLESYPAAVSGVTIATTINHATPSEGIEGGVIYSDNYMHLNGLKITSTSNSGYYIEGGVIYSNDYATVNNVSATGTTNAAPYSSGGYIDGGGFYNDDYLSSTGLTFTGITNVASVVGTTPSSFTTYVEGGAFYNDDYAILSHFTVNGVTSHASGGSGYVEGGVFANYDLLNLRDSQMLGATVTADWYAEGGLLYSDDYINANNVTIGGSLVRVLGSPIHTSPYGEGTLLYSSSSSTFTNFTLANNTALMAGHGSYNWAVQNHSTLAFTNSTFANDSLGGPGSKLLWADISTAMYLRNSIVASNFPSLNCGGPGLIKSSGHNIDTGSSCHFLSAGDFQVTNPKILGLANNGGPIKTAGFLMPSSPALNHGSNAGCPTTDARGVPRPQHGICDIGAYEAVYK
jgi:hypothetical protein